MLLVNLGARAQTSSASSQPGVPGSDALPFLTELLARYTHASSYHLEYIEEHQFDSEFSGNCSKAFITSIVGPANHYRFERRVSSVRQSKSPMAKPSGFITPP
jgi:hypothetical protein